MVLKKDNEEAKQMELLDNLPCGAALYQYDGERISIVHINKTYWQLVERKQSSSPNIFNMIHPEDRKIVEPEVKAALRQKRNLSLDFRVRCGESGYKAFHVVANIVKQDDGTYLFYVSYTPISQKAMSIQKMLPVALSTMMSISEDIAYLKDRDMHYICCSESAAKVIGLSNAQDIAGKRDLDIFDKKTAERFLAQDLKVIEKGEAQTVFTEKIPGIDGKIHLAETSKYPIMDDLGNVIGIYGVSRDVTEQKEKESQLELLASSIPGGIAAYAVEYGKLSIVYFNDGFCEYSGCTREEYARIVADNPLAFIFEEDKVELCKMIKNLPKQEDGHRNEFVFRCNVKGGGYKWIRIRTALSKLDENHAVVNVVLLDVTAQQEEKERLRMSEEVNRLAINHSGNIVTRFDVAKRILILPDFLNPIFELPQVLNNMPEEQIELGRVSADTADAYRGIFEEIVRGKKEGEATYKQFSSKGWRWLEVKYTTVFSDDGKPVSAVISFADVTDRLKKEIAYKRWQQALENRPRNSYTLFRCNLNKGNSFESWEGKLLDINFAGVEDTFDKRAEEFMQQCVYEEDRERYRDFVNADAMLAGYYRGHRSDEIEFRQVLGKDKLRWLRLSIDLVKYPASNDVEAYLMYEDIDAQKRASLAILKRSESDSLTGILNRAAFISHMNSILAASKSSEKHAFLMVDIDNFKQVNDVWGHAAGDEVLKNLTSKVKTILRHNDIFCRLGGDEFIIFLKNIPGKEVAAAKAKKICTMNISPDSDTNTNGEGSTVTVSIGIALIPENGSDFDTLYQNADQALYKCKENGKNRYEFASEHYECKTI